jgi:hypothetical protein
MTKEQERAVEFLSNNDAREKCFYDRVRLEKELYRGNGYGKYLLRMFSYFCGQEKRGFNHQEDAILLDKFLDALGNWEQDMRFEFFEEMEKAHFKKWLMNRVAKERVKRYMNYGWGK